MPLEDPAIGKQLERAFRKRGIGFRTGIRRAGASRAPTTVLLVTLEGGDAARGRRRPGRGRSRTGARAGLGYEEHGIELDRGWVVVDDRLRTSVPGVYAVGDLVPGLQLAHRGFAHGIFVAEEIAGLAPDAGRGPRHPARHLLRAGDRLGRAHRAAGPRAGTATSTTYAYDLAGNGKSQILGTTGFVKVVREKDGPIVGVHMLGARMGEQVGEAALWVGWEALPEDVARFVHAHPTQNEALGEAALALAGKPLHAHG